MATKRKPEIITLSDKALEDLKSRLVTITTPMQEEDKKILLSIVSAYSWISSQLQAAKLSIHRLKRLFGFSTEKRSRLKKKDDFDLNLQEPLFGAKQSLELSAGVGQSESGEPEKK